MIDNINSLFHKKHDHTFQSVFKFFVIGCRDELPEKMTSNRKCKSLEKSCSNLTNKCRSKLSSALGSSRKARKCKTALGSDKNKKVQSYCKLACNNCGRLIEWFNNLLSFVRFYHLWSIIRSKLSFHKFICAFLVNMLCNHHFYCL